MNEEFIMPLGVTPMPLASLKIPCYNSSVLGALKSAVSHVKASWRAVLFCP